MGKVWIRFFILCFFINTAMAQISESKKTYEDIKQTLGSVPTFLKEFPENGIAGAWQDMKGIQLNPKTAIPGRYKELIGLAVAAQIPCHYCVYFHRKATALNQGTEQEMKEAIAMAANVRRGSTIIFGAQTDFSQFKAEVDKMFPVRSMQAMEDTPREENPKEKKTQDEQTQAQTPSIQTAEDAYNDMKNTFGFVPGFMKNYPPSGVAGWWKEMKEIEGNPQTKIPGKYKDLIGIAVASQVPCQYCVYYHTKSALQKGATQEEINEAVAMAGITRVWSTVLNGSIMKENKFREETDKIMNYLEKKEKKVSTL